MALRPPTEGTPSTATFESRVRSVESDSRERGINVKQSPYNATGDGSTNDTAAIQAALDAAPVGIPVIVPDGTYVAAGLTITGKELRGTGTLKLKASASDPLITLGAGAALSEVAIDGNGANQSTTNPLVVISGDGGEVRGTRITGARAACIRVNQNAENAIVERNRLTGNGIVSSCTGIEVKGSYAVVRGNIVEGHSHLGHAIRVGRFATDTAQITDGVVVANNILRDEEGLDAVVGGGVAIIAELDSRCVSIIGNQISNYNHAIKGDNCEYLAVHGNVIEGCPTVTVLNFTVAPHTSFTGNVIRNCGSGPIMGAHIVCSNNIFDTVGTGTGQIIRAYGPQATVSNNVLDSCTSPLAQIRVGPDVGPEAGYTVTGNLIEDPTGPATHYGIYVANVSYVNVADNKVLGALSTGIRFLSTASNVVCKDNHIPDATTKVDWAGATAFIADNMTGALPTIASGAGLNLKGNRVVGITGTTSVTSITAEAPGIFFLKFAGVLTMTDGNNLKLAGNFVTAADATLTLFSDGTNFYEIARSTN